jgi:hypothetical protein
MHTPRCLTLKHFDGAAHSLVHVAPAHVRQEIVSGSAGRGGTAGMGREAGAVTSLIAAIKHRRMKRVPGSAITTHA